MTGIAAILLPIAELLGVIALAILLVSALVGALVALLKALSNRGAVASWRLLVALRLLTGSVETGWRRRLVPVSAQNFIAMVGTAIGVWALVVVLSVMGGFESDLKGKIVRNSPHVLATPEKPPQDDAGWKALEARLRALPHVVAAESFADGEAMVTSAVNMSPGLTIHGVAPGGDLERLWLARSASPESLAALAQPAKILSDRELGFRAAAGEPGDEVPGPAVPRRASDVREPTRDSPGPMPAIPADRDRRGRLLPAVLLGEELASSLSVSVGDEVTAVVPDGDVGPTGVRPRTRTLRVAGTFLTGMYEYDLKTAYVAELEGEHLFLLGGPNRVAVMIDDLDRLDEVSAAVTGVLAAAGGGEVRTVAQANRSLFSALMVEKVAMFLVLGLVILVAAFNVFGSLLLITMERTRDIAVLQSLGATRAGVRGVFLAIGGVIGLVGTVAGLVLGLGTCLYVTVMSIPLPAEYYLRSLPVEVRPLEVLAVTAAALGSGVIATLYPARTAARLTPSEGLRND